MGLSPVALYDAVYADVMDFGVGAFEPHPNPSCTYKQFACSYLLHSIIRKWIPNETTEQDRSAYEAFMSANNRCKTWRLTAEWEIDRVVYGEIRRILDDFFHPQGELLFSTYFDLLRSGRPGPGASVGSQGTSYYTKYFASELTTTSPYLYEEYRNYAEWIPFLSDAECQRYEKFGPPRIVSGSRCSFVPKTNRISRMICVEPSLNMWFQLGLAQILQQRLKGYFGIELETQPDVNRRLAQQGSRDGSLATIDLTSASDSISLSLCEEFLPRWVYDLLLQLRSPSTEINGQSVDLNMISTMGNGFTFPLQTILFSAVVLACRNVFATTNSPFSWSVFGDDIVVPSKYARHVIHYLRLLNFEANKDKTFCEGPFRESCGSDWFYGQPVRPVFIKKLDLPYDYLVAINQLNEWSAYTGIPLQGTVSLLMDQLEPRFKNLVPFDSSFDSGIRVPSILLPSVLRDRNNSYIFETWERVPSRITVGEGALRGPGRLRKLWYNPDGLYCSFLFGELNPITSWLGITVRCIGKGCGVLLTGITPLPRALLTE